MTVDDIWNHNLQYQQVLVDAVTSGCATALDVGCGQGFLLPHLAARVDTVIGIDRHAPSLAEAAARTARLPNVELVDGDAMTYDFGRLFDAVFSIAVIHHLPFEPGLRRMRELTAPGGVLGVVGLARSTTLRDYARDGVGAVETRLRRLRRPFTMVTAPVCDPDESYTEVRRIVAAELPGARVRRHNLFRYSIVWTRPR